jgi:serine/threonine protein phosphatase PrpC
VAREIVFSTVRMQENEKKILKEAFSSSLECGIDALKHYMKGETYTEQKRTIDEKRAKENFRKAIEKILGLEAIQDSDQELGEHLEDLLINKRYPQKFPEKESSLDNCLDMVAEARQFVADPETAAIPGSYFARVLAGATLAEIDLSSSRARYAALKKSANVEERLNRWSSFDTAYRNFECQKNFDRFNGAIEGGHSSFDPKKLKERFQRGIDSLRPLPQQITGIPEENPCVVGGYECGVAHLQGLRSRQEDCSAYGTVEIGAKKLPFFAICDGHGVKTKRGLLAPEFVSENLKAVLQKNLEGKDIENISDEHLENLLASLTVQLDSMFFEHEENDGFGGGTTLTMAFILPRGEEREVWVVNVGDSRTLAVMSERTYQLTEDATPNNARFKASCDRAGLVRVEYYSYIRQEHEERLSKVIHLNPGLAVARSIGEDNKGHDNIEEGIQKPLPRAKVTRMKIPRSEKVDLILHCDGLNEVFCSDDIGEITRNRALKTAQEKTEALVGAAFIGGSNDNLSAVVVEIPSI